MRDMGKETGKVPGLISLAMKAGAVVSGEFMVEKSVKSGKACLVILAEDASENTKKKFTNMCTFYRVPVRELSTKDDLGRSIGRTERSSLAITDVNFAQAVAKALDKCSTRR